MFSTWDKPMLSETGLKFLLPFSYYFCLIDLNDAILAADDSNSVQVDGNAIRQTWWRQLIDCFFRTYWQLDGCLTALRHLRSNSLVVSLLTDFIWIIDLPKALNPCVCCAFGNALFSLQTQIGKKISKKGLLCFYAQFRNSPNNSSPFSVMI